MKDNIRLCNQTGKSTVIYTQYSGENDGFKDLSMVSKGRLAAMYKIYLEYLKRDEEDRSGR